MASLLRRAKATAESVAKYAKENGVRKTLNAMRMTGGLRKSGIVMPPGARLCGEDKFGNKYYECTDEIMYMDRWVVYKNSDTSMYDPSSVTPEWHAWIHRMTDKTPVEEPRTHPIYQKEAEAHPLPSEFGIGAKYVPPGHALRADTKKFRKYERWGEPSK